jgi:hypothetical protein
VRLLALIHVADGSRALLRELGPASGHGARQARSCSGHPIPIAMSASQFSTYRTVQRDSAVPTAPATACAIANTCAAPRWLCAAPRGSCGGGPPPPPPPPCGVREVVHSRRSRGPAAAHRRRRPRAVRSRRWAEPPPPSCPRPSQRAARPRRTHGGRPWRHPRALRPRAMRPGRCWTCARRRSSPNATCAAPLTFPWLRCARSLANGIPATISSNTAHDGQGPKANPNVSPVATQLAARLYELPPMHCAPLRLFGDSSQLAAAQELLEGRG